MKTPLSQKKKAVRRGIWVLVLLALLILSGYRFLPGQSLDRVETTLAIPPTRVLVMERVVGGQVRYLSMNEHLLLYSVHQFSPLEGWTCHDRSLVKLEGDSPVWAHGFRKEGRGSQILGVPLKELHLKNDLLIAGIIRERKPIIPGGDDVIMPGDKVIVLTADRRLTDLSDIFG